MFNIAVIDDELRYLEKIENVLNAYECFDVQSFSDPEQFLLAFKSHSFDLLFLDIEMPHVNGLQLLDRLEEANTQSLIIFITNNSSYMINCFNKNVIGFVPKENFDETIHIQIDKALKFLSPKKYLFETEYGRKELTDNEIVAITLELRKIFLLLNNGNKICLRYRTFNDVLNIIDNSLYFQINRSTLVNLSKVTKYSSNDIFLIDIKQPMQLSKYRKSDFMIAYFEHSLRRK